MKATDDVVLDVMNSKTEKPVCDEKGNPFRIFFFNIDSREYIVARNAHINMDRKQTARGRVKTIEEEIESGVEFLASITKGWANMPTLSASEPPLEFNDANTRKLYSRYHWLRAQIDTRMMQAGLRVNLPSPPGTDI
jgi:hypothetical protein